jgi:flagellar biosynthesis GTPase FlhF
MNYIFIESNNLYRKHINKLFIANIVLLLYLYRNKVGAIVQVQSVSRPPLPDSYVFEIGKSVEAQFTDGNWYGCTINERVAAGNMYKIQWQSGAVYGTLLPASKIRLTAADAEKIQLEEANAKAAAALEEARKKSEESNRRAKAEEDARIAKELEAKKKKDAEAFAKAEQVRKAKAEEERKKMEKSAQEARERQEKLKAEADAKEALHANQLTSPSVGLYTYQNENNPGKIVRSTSLGLYSNNGFGDKCNLSKSMQSPSIGVYTHLFVKKSYANDAAHK